MTAPGTAPGSFTGWWVKRNVVMFPPTIALTITGWPPITVPGTFAVPITAALTLTGSVPTIVSGLGIGPSAVSLTLTGHEPTVRGGVFAAPAAATLTLTGHVSVLDSGIRPAGAALTLTGHVPVLDSGIRPAAVTPTLTGHAPTVVVSVPITFDAVGAGDTDSGAVATASWSHTCTGSNRAVLVAAVSAVPNGTTGPKSATYGGNAMTLLASIDMDGANRRWGFLFGLLNPPTGAQTVTFQVEEDGQNFSAFAAATSVSYTNVSSFGATDTESGSGTSRSQTVASAVGELLVQTFGQNHATAMSAYNQTFRDDIYLDAGTDVGVLVGDATGTGSNVSFSATGSSASWSAVAVRLQPV